VICDVQAPVALGSEMGLMTIAIAMPHRIFITVADPSGDQHAALLIHSLRALSPDVVIEAFGGPKMRAAGAAVHVDTVANAAMGWRGALRAREVAGWINWLRDYYAREKFDLHICCDSWSMNWHFARLAKELGTPTLYYIAPQAWASRERRVLKLRQYVDQLACILPFEEAFFCRHEVNAKFVGHPLFDELPPRAGWPVRVLEPARPVIGLLPGSRTSIAEANFPRLLGVARQIREQIPGATFLVPSTPQTHDVVQKLLATQRLPVEVRQDAFDDVVPRCDLVITVSGTAALHTAAFGVPLMVVYHGNPLLWHLVGRWVVKTRTYSLVNLLSDSPEKIVPEFIPWYGSTQPVADYALDLLRHPEKLDAQRQQLRRMIGKLDAPGASMNVARLAMSMVQSRPAGVS